MADLQSYSAKICLTASGTLIYQNKILLIKHKKLGLWMCPGGHMESDELPHQAAEREFWEETGIKVKALLYGFQPDNSLTEFLPIPISTNLHWVSQENYQRRLKNPDTFQVERKWAKGCEQHYNQNYLVEPMAGVDFSQNLKETDGIDWFSEAEICDLETSDQIILEIRNAFEKYHHYVTDHS